MKPEKAIAVLMNSNEYHHAKGDLPHSALSIEAFNMAIEALKEQRPHGEWIDRSDGGRIRYSFWERYECSKCGAKSENTNFCPNCGSDMRGGEAE